MQLTRLFFQKVSSFYKVPFKVDIIQRSAFHLASPAGCMDKLTFADVNAHMNHPSSAGYRKKNQVCRLKVLPGDGFAVVELGFGCSWDMGSDLFVGIYHQA